MDEELRDLLHVVRVGRHDLNANTTAAERGQARGTDALGPTDDLWVILHVAQHCFGVLEPVLQILGGFEAAGMDLHMSGETEDKSGLHLSQPAIVQGPEEGQGCEEEEAHRSSPSNAARRRRFARNTPAATAEPITPATFGPIACMRRKLVGSSFWPTTW